LRISLIAFGSVFAVPPMGVKVKFAVTLSLPFRLSFLLAFRVGTTRSFMAPDQLSCGRPWYL
jgi:hypothetical protein